MTVTRNDNLIFLGDNSGYNFMAYMTNLLSFGENVKETLLRTEGWCTDLPGEFDAEGANDAWISRRFVIIENHNFKLTQGKWTAV